jgi:hypothetical protein
MTPMLTAIATGLLLSSTAASTARDDHGQKPSKAAPAQAQSGPKYCIVYDDVTGSRVRQRECQTREQWATEGVNVDEPASH